MNGVAQLLFGIAMAVGLLGVVVPVVPGLLLVLVAAVLWGLEVGSWQGWLVVAVMAMVMAVGTWTKYQVPGRELTEMSLSTRTWVLAVGGGIVGFFVVPVIGLLVGFVVGIHLGERVDRGSHRAGWASTRRVLGGVGKGIAIEFAAGFLAVVTWVTAVLAGV